MRLLSIEKTRKKLFSLVRGLNCFGVIVRSSPHITKDWGNSEGLVIKNESAYFETETTKIQLKK